MPKVDLVAILEVEVVAVIVPEAKPMKVKLACPPDQVCTDQSHLRCHHLQLQ